MSVIVKPLITEKQTAIAEKSNRYAFVVNMDANKIEIKNSVEQMYGVKVVEINTMIARGKNKSRFTKAGLLKGKSSARKKAVVTLAKGDVIDFYSNI